MMQMRRNTWRPAAFTAGNIKVITLILALVAINRGMDYLTPPEKTSDTYSVFEKAFPVWVWGYTFVAGGVILLAGMLLRSHRAVWIGHTVCGIAYGALTLALLLPLLPYSDGVRSIGTLTTVTALHIILWLRTGARPLPESETEAPVVAQVQGDHK